MPEIVSNGNTGEEPKVESETHHEISVDIETLKHSAKIESANLIAAERRENEAEIPIIEIETAPAITDEPEPFHSNGNGTAESQPEVCTLEHQNGDMGTEPVAKENGNGHLGDCNDQQNDEPEYDYVQQPLKSHEQDFVCPIVPPTQLEIPEPQDPVPELPEPVPQDHQPDLICSMVKNEKPVLQESIETEKEPEPDVYREPVVCEMRAKFTEPKVHNEVPVTNGVGAKKGVLNTKLDTASLKKSYEAVRSDQDETEWAVFKFDGPILTTKATGTDFLSFQKQFGEAERAFAYIRIQTGDEMSKRQKFLLVTWIGPEVSVLQRAKMSTDKAFVKTVVSNFAVELQPETAGEINMDHFVAELDKAGGAHYGTGV